jgi:hypothetical protein
MNDFVLSALLSINQVLSAGNTITAFSLLLYSLTFNLRERVARSFAQLLACLTVVFFGDVLASTAASPLESEIWLKLQWIGISLVPATYMHFSDSLLAATGRPSRGRRHLVIRLSYLAGLGFLLLVGLTEAVVGPVVLSDSVSFLRAGPWFWLFTLFFFIIIGFSAYNFWRAYARCLTRASRRRMRYLMAGAVAPLISAYPFLILTHDVVLGYPRLFWAVMAIVNALMGVLVVVMAYAVAYFGVSIPDRVVKSRLFQWILRGPVVASTVLAVTIFINRLGHLVGIENTRAVPFFMVGSLLLLQFIITLIRPGVERWLFYGEDREEIRRLHLLEERLLTTGDLRQFLESVLNAICDVTGIPSAFVAVVGAEGLELEVSVGSEDPLHQEAELPPVSLTAQPVAVGPLERIVVWDRHWLLPLTVAETGEVIGLLGVQARAERPDFTADESFALKTLCERATVALVNRALQKEIFGVVDRLVPRVEVIQRLRVAASYGSPSALAGPVEEAPQEGHLVAMVREALGHYWGGPRLSGSPLLGLRVVREAMKEHEGNPVNALRAVLRRAIETVRPEGDRRFTADWMLYNILELKFVEGRKVRDVAMRLAMSEADLYRKQRVAIEVVAKAVGEMEREAHVKGGTLPHVE